MFAIDLSNRGDPPFDSARLLEALRAERWIRQLRADSSRFYYHDRDTSVVFSMFAGQIHGEEMDEPDGAMEEDYESDADEDAPTHDAIDISVAPLTIMAPLLCPSFFGREAIGVASRLAGALGLDVVAGGLTAAPEILAEWERARREEAADLKDADRQRLAYWPEEKTESWWRYGSNCQALEAELAADGVHVPRLEAARHQGIVKSLVVWESGTPTVFPRTDLVLVRRERERRGLLHTRRVVEEGLVSGERIWEILASFGEIRNDPTSMLIFREARKPPQQVAAQLETLVLEPVTNAKKTELIDLIDFEVRAGEESPA
jgi:hypothetical protein